MSKARKRPHRNSAKSQIACWFGTAVVALILGGLHVFGQDEAEERPAPTAPRNVDAHGDLLPEGAIARIGSSRFRHGSEIQYIAYSPDGRTLASVAVRNLRLWDAATGRELHVFEDRSESGRPVTVAFSPDGKQLAIGWQRTTTLHEVESGRLVRTCDLPPTVVSLAFSSDGQTLAAASTNGTISFVSPETGKPVAKEQSARATRLRFLPQDGRIAVLEQGRYVRVRSVQDGSVVWDTSKLAPDGVRIRFTSMDVSRDGRFLVTGGASRSVRVWDLAESKLHREFNGGNSNVYGVAISPDGKTVASGGSDKTLRVWDVESGNQRLEARGHQGYVVSVAFSPDGSTIATGGRSHGNLYDRTIRLWDAVTGKPKLPSLGLELPIESVALSPDGQTLATGSADTSLSLWDFPTQKLLRQWRPVQSTAFTQVAFSPDGNLLATTSTDRVVLREPRTGESLKELPIVGAQIRCVRFSPDGKLLAASDSRGRIVLCDVPELRVLHTMQGRGDTWCLDFTPDGKSLAAASINRRTQLWNVADGKLLIEFPEQQRSVRGMAISPDGRILATGAIDESILVRELASGQIIKRLNCAAGVRALVFLPDSRTLIAGNQHNQVFVWDVANTANGDHLHQFNGRHGAWVSAMACSADGRTLISSSSDATALVWDLQTALSKRSELAATESADEQDVLWQSLAGVSAARAERAYWQLVGGDDRTVASFERRLQPTQPNDDALERVPQLIAELDDADFKVREAAHRQLEELGPRIRPEVETALANTDSFEPRKRLRRILKALDRRHTGTLADATLLRKVRAVSILQHIATPSALALLQQLAERSTEAPVAEQAAFAAERLSRRIALDDAP